MNSTNTTARPSPRAFVEALKTVGWTDAEIIAAGEFVKSQTPPPEKGERIPSGWKLVPVEPIDGMIVAALRARCGYRKTEKAIFAPDEIEFMRLGVRAAIGAAPLAKAEDGMREVDDAMVERANVAYETSVQALYAQAVHTSVDLAEVRTKSMRAALRAALAKEGTP